MFQKISRGIKYKIGCTLKYIREHPFQLRLSPTKIIILILLITKIVAFIYLFNLEYIEPYGKLTPDRWWLVFHRWDSAYYDKIASFGYVDLKDWAFMPAFPGAIKVISFLVGNSYVSTALAGLIFGILWVPVYYKVAAAYVGENTATYSTLLFAFFPTVYLFTSVGYTEGLWLTSSLLGWYFYLKNKHFISSSMLALSVLTRVPGIILPALILLRKITQRKIKQALVYLLPFVALISWVAYGFLQTGVPAAFITAQQETVWNSHLNFVELFLAQIMGGSTPSAWNEQSVFLIIAIALFAYLCIKVFDVDKFLGIYSVCSLAFLLTAGYYLSLSRFLPFIFPIWLNIKVNKKPVVAAYIILCFILTLVLWSEFLNDRWVG